MKESFEEKFINGDPNFLRDHIDWERVLKKYRLSESFIEKYIIPYVEKHNFINFHIIKHQKLSEKFIEKHFLDHNNAYFVVVNAKLSENFLNKHKDIFSIRDFVLYQKVSAKFIKQNIKSLTKDDFENILLNENIPDKVKEEIKLLKEII